MLLHELHNVLTNLFEPSHSFMYFPKGVTCYSLDFQSDFISAPRYIKEQATPDEKKILTEPGTKTNQNFKYLVITPNEAKQSGAILLLHGLNERSWDKYLIWAYQLVRQTGKAVILFPIAYHINRAPSSWSNPREMISLVRQRKEQHRDIEKSSFANVALSLRMEYTTEMFAISGIQTYFDIVKLAFLITTGNHWLFKKNTSINIFAYSIGGLLAQILLLANPASLFSGQKAFLFCAGATFDKMNGVSKAIMDSAAFKKLIYYFNGTPNIKNDISLPLQFASLLPNAWESFLTMISSKNNIQKREQGFSAMKDRIKAIGLTQDTVIPPKAIKETIPQSSSEIDFPFPYTHEMPFPINSKYSEEKVDHSFNEIMNEAANFLK
jgi:pimeloyl-ACP methyl ester carboxylesterase